MKAAQLAWLPWLDVARSLTPPGATKTLPKQPES